MTDRIATNSRCAARLLFSLLIPGLALVGVLWGVLGTLGLVAGLIACVVGVAPLVIYTREAERRSIAVLGAVPADPIAHARLYNVIDGLCAGAGIPRPDPYVIDTPAMNATSVGRDPRRACLVVTSGLLEGLSLIELEGVVAHELAHIRSLDTRVPTLLLSLPWLLRRGVPARLAGSVVGQPSSEVEADVAGVAMTRYPPGLAAALEKLAAADASDAGGSPGRGRGPVAPLWIKPEGAELGERVDILREL